MNTHGQAVAEFLSGKVIAVAGASRDPKKGVGCFLIGKLLKAGKTVYPINPHAERVGDLVCYPDLKSVPERIDGVLLLTNPKDALGVVRQCAELGIGRVWFHRSFGQGSYSAEAEQFCQEHGIQVVAIACPAMYLEPDIAHRCFKFFLRVTGKV